MKAPRKRPSLQLLRVVLHRTPKPVRIDGWVKRGPFWIPDKHKVKP